MERKRNSVHLAEQEKQVKAELFSFLGALLTQKLKVQLTFFFFNFLDIREQKYAGRENVISKD